jgi:hypothetical protein
VSELFSQECNAARLLTRFVLATVSFSESANKKGKRLRVPLPISMHSGQIIMLTKMLTASDLHFYDFEASAPVERWR